MTAKNNTPAVVEEPVEEKVKCIIWNKTVMEPYEDEFIRSYKYVKEIDFVETTPTCIWKGAKIPYTEWQKILGFMIWSQEEFKAEAQGRLYFNRNTQEWRFWAFPQEPNGMTTRELPEHPNRAEDAKQFGKGWMCMGTIHHHCTAGAFQSGTDEANENSQNGLHITLGKMESEVLDIHIRFMFDGVKYLNYPLSHYVEGPAWSQHIPVQSLRNYCNDKALLNADIADYEFPQRWKDNCIKKVYGYQGTKKWKDAKYNAQTNQWVDKDGNPIDSSVGGFRKEISEEKGKTFPPYILGLNKNKGLMDSLELMMNQANLCMFWDLWKAANNAFHIDGTGYKSDYPLKACMRSWYEEWHLKNSEFLDFTAMLAIEEEDAWNKAYDQQYHKDQDLLDGLEYGPEI